MRFVYRLLIGLAMVGVIYYGYKLMKHRKPTNEKTAFDVQNNALSTATGATPKTITTVTGGTTHTTLATTPGSTIPARKLQPTNVPIYVCGNSTDYIDMKSITPEGRPKVDIFINIPVAGTWTIRRNIIRNGWLSTVKNYSVAYRFFTDGIGVDPKVLEALKKEQEEFKDLVIIPTKNGYWLTHRYLHAMFWGYKHYDFKYYLKADDDYFICLNNLMNDLQYRHKEKFLYWGHFGCERKMIAMDEGFVIISIDLAQEIIKRNNSLCCSPFGGQMIAMWVNLLEHEGYDVTYFPDNSRLMHYRSYLKKPSNDMCKRLLGIHQSYPKYMKLYWNMTKDSWYSLKKEDFEKVERKEYKDYCSLPKGWDWRVLGSFYRKEPKPCWQPGLTWPDLEKIKAIRSRENDE
ncbi:hypothetical protein QZH41_005605 [Actinostola sp. cb2023]|nr:hypothetical protein QZH41_005605 [Actinostola sp. cb2023]